MKKYFTLLLIFACSVYCKGQIIYYDAFSLQQKKDPDIDNRILLSGEIKQLLAPYYPGVKVADIDTALLNANPFFKGHFEPKAIQDIGKALNALSLSSVGGINVTNFADGLAKFLVKRFKEELSITFFERFDSALNDRRFEEMRILFPQTVSVLNVIGKEIYNFSKYLNSLREAFIKDLGNLYVAIKRVKDLPKYTHFFEEHKEIKTVIDNAFYFIDQFSAGTHPGQVIANYNEKMLLNFKDSSLQLNMRSSVKALKLFSYSLKSVSPDRYWVQGDSVKSMLADTMFRDMYFGLIYLESKNKDIVFRTGTRTVTFQEVLGKAKATEMVLLQYQAHVERIMDHVQEVNEYIAEIREKKRTEIDYNDYYKLFNASLDVIDEGLRVIDLPGLNINPDTLRLVNVTVAELVWLSRTAGELYTDVRTRNYSSAVLNTVAILDTIFRDNFNSELRENILKYGGFMATVATAENSDEVEQAIEAIALPVGSSRIKRESTYNIALNAYVGGFAGVEYMPTLPNNNQGFVFGLSAPVGVSFSKGGLGKGKNNTRGGKSATVFISIIDIGALATFRLNDDDSKVAAEIELKNIIAPGVFFFYGFGKCPISLGAGVQIGPQLREVTTTDINVEKNFYIHYGITLAVDIPILNFYTKSR
jgi:hypothetical protein